MTFFDKIKSKRQWCVDHIDAHKTENPAADIMPLSLNPGVQIEGDKTGHMARALLVRSVSDARRYVQLVDAGVAAYNDGRIEDSLGLFYTAGMLEQRIGTWADDLSNTLRLGHSIKAGQGKQQHKAKNEQLVLDRALELQRKKSDWSVRAIAKQIASEWKKLGLDREFNIRTITRWIEPCLTKDL